MNTLPIDKKLILVIGHSPEEMFTSVYVNLGMLEKGTFPTIPKSPRLMLEHMLDVASEGRTTMSKEEARKIVKKEYAEDPINFIIKYKRYYPTAEEARLHGQETDVVKILEVFSETRAVIQSLIDGFGGSDRNPSFVLSNINKIMTDDFQEVYKKLGREKAFNNLFESSKKLQQEFGLLLDEESIRKELANLSSSPGETENLLDQLEEVQPEGGQEKEAFVVFHPKTKSQKSDEQK